MSAPYKLTKGELFGIAKNTDKVLSSNPKTSDYSLATMRAQMYLKHIGVPVDFWPQAAVEASFRAAFMQETESTVRATMGGRTLLRVVKPDKLDREPFPEHLIKTN